MYLGHINVSAGALANTFGLGIIDIDFYKGSRLKAVRFYGGVDQNSTSGANSGVGFGQGQWRSNNAINSITILSNIGGDFNTNCYFALYGIRGAS